MIVKHEQIINGECSGRQKVSEECPGVKWTHAKSVSGKYHQ